MQMISLKNAVMCLLTLCLSAGPSSAEVQWEDAIKAVSEKSTRYYDYAKQLGHPGPGNALSGIGFNQHKCAIVGRMLGLLDEIKEAEVFDDPPLSPDADAHELMVHSMFLEAWVAAATDAVAMKDRQRQSFWNLECPGNYGIPIDSYIDDSSIEADFVVRDRTLFVYGDIDTSFHARFVTALDQNPSIKTVAIGSGGGSVSDAVLSGYEIRKRGLDGVVAETLPDA